MDSLRSPEAPSIDVEKTFFPMMPSSCADEIPHDRDKSDIIPPTTCSKITILEEYLRFWYEGVSPRYVDLVNDFAGQEFFLLDGEALLQYVFNDRMLDLAGSTGGIHPIPITFTRMMC